MMVSFPVSTSRWPRTISLVLAIAVIVYAVMYPAGLGSHGSTVDRLFGALLMVGAIGAALDGLNWQSERRHIRLLTDRRFTWPAILAGAAWGLIAA
jgi:hypothetical protein